MKTTIDTLFDRLMPGAHNTAAFRNLNNEWSFVHTRVEELCASAITEFFSHRNQKVNYYRQRYTDQLDRALDALPRVIFKATAVNASRDVILSLVNAFSHLEVYGRAIVSQRGYRTRNQPLSRDQMTGWADTLMVTIIHAQRLYYYVNSYYGKLTTGADRAQVGMEMTNCTGILRQVVAPKVEFTSQLAFLVDQLQVDMGLGCLFLQSCLSKRTALIRTLADMIESGDHEIDHYDKAFLAVCICNDTPEDALRIYQQWIENPESFERDRDKIARQLDSEREIVRKLVKNSSDQLTQVEMIEKSLKSLRDMSVPSCVLQHNLQTK